MKKIIFFAIALSLLAIGCQKVKLQQETPTAPQASYQELPR